MPQSVNVTDQIVQAFAPGWMYEGLHVTGCPVAILVREARFSNRHHADQIIFPVELQRREDANGDMLTLEEARRMRLLVFERIESREVIRLRGNADAIVKLLGNRFRRLAAGAQAYFYSNLWC